MAVAELNAPPAELSHMTKMQKLAALLIILGPDTAAQILKHFDEHELTTISGEMAKFSLVSQELRDAVLDEFQEVAQQARTATFGGVDYTRSALEKSVGRIRASDIMIHAAPRRASVPVIQQLTEMAPRQIFNLIKHEQPQTIALILSHLDTEKSSTVLILIRPDLRDQVLERLAGISATPVEVIERVARTLSERLACKDTRPWTKTGGVRNAADLLNALDKNLSNELLASIEGRNPELGQAIRKKMYLFEDLTNLDPAALQKVLRDVDMQDLILALATASEDLKATLLACVSKRAAATIKEEISFIPSVKPRVVEAARGRIIEVVRRLESEGEIELSASEEAKADEIMA